MSNKPNNLQFTLTYILLCVQLMRNKRISYTEMAELGGVSQRTFAEWMRGGYSPAAVEAVLRMLALLPGDQIEKAIEVWRPSPPQRLNEPRKKSGRNSQSNNPAAE
ncbi:MAG: helix-turn-helix domain-containing protein [Nitrosomonadales bacterium]|nr:helix-turn-helix domain-containing protein [Nitrosomonadales bacterium]